MSDETNDSRPNSDGLFKGPLDQDTFRALLFNSFLHQQRRVRVTRQEGERLAALAEARREVGRASDLNAALNLVAARSLEIMGATGAAIAITRQGNMTCCAVSGPTAPPLGVLVPESGLSGECLRNGRALRCDDTAGDPRVDQEACTRLGGLRSMLLVPLSQHHSPVGILEVFSTTPFAFDESDEHVLEMLAAIACATIAEFAETGPPTRPSRTLSLGTRPSPPQSPPA